MAQLEELEEKAGSLVDLLREKGNMRRTKTGWVAQREGGESWTISGITADGIFIVPTAAITYLHLAGTVDEEAGPRLEIPTDAMLLEELATAFEELATWRKNGGWGDFHK